MEDFNHFPELADALSKALSDVVKNTALDVQSRAAGNAPYDTGFLASSIYVETTDGSTYGQAISPPGDSYLLPVIDKPDDDWTAYIAVGANYGVYQEFGTRYMPARPFLAPATEAAQDTFASEIESIESKLGGGR